MKRQGFASDVLMRSPEDAETILHFEQNTQESIDDMMKLVPEVRVCAHQHTPIHKAHAHICMHPNDAACFSL